MRFNIVKPVLEIVWPKENLGHDILVSKIFRVSRRNIASEWISSRRRNKNNVFYSLKVKQNIKVAFIELRFFFFFKKSGILYFPSLIYYIDAWLLQIMHQWMHFMLFFSIIPIDWRKNIFRDIIPFWSLDQNIIPPDLIWMDQCYQHHILMIGLSKLKINIPSIQAKCFNSMKKCCRILSFHLIRSGFKWDIAKKIVFETLRKIVINV